MQRTPPYEPKRKQYSNKIFMYGNRQLFLTADTVLIKIQRKRFIDDCPQINLLIATEA